MVLAQQRIALRPLATLQLGHLDFLFCRLKVFRIRFQPRLEDRGSICLDFNLLTHWRKSIGRYKDVVQPRRERNIKFTAFIDFDRHIACDRPMNQDERIPYRDFFICICYISCQPPILPLRLQRGRLRKSCNRRCKSQQKNSGGQALSYIVVSCHQAGS